MEVPRAYKNGDVTMDEMQGGQIAYYYSADSDMDFDVYQFPKPDSEAGLQKYLYAAAADFDGTEVAYRQINGVNVGSYKSREIYDGVEYDVLVALMEEGAEYVQVIFWLDGENAEQEAMDILNTIAPIETRELQLGDSPFRLTIPADYQPGEVTAEQAADDMIGYYYNETTPLDFDVYEFGKNGFTLEKYAIEESKRYEAERVDYQTINGIDIAVYYSYEEYDGQSYRVCNYLFEYGDDFVENEYSIFVYTPLRSVLVSVLQKIAPEYGLMALCFLFLWVNALRIRKQGAPVRDADRLLKLGKRRYVNLSVARRVVPLLIVGVVLINIISGYLLVLSSYATHNEKMSKNLSGLVNEMQLSDEEWGKIEEIFQDLVTDRVSMIAEFMRIMGEDFDRDTLADLTKRLDLVSATVYDGDGVAVMSTDNYIGYALSQNPDDDEYIL